MEKEKRNKGGRKPLIEGHPEKFELLLQAKRLGMPDKYACQYAGMTYDTLNDTRNKGKRDLEAGEEETAYAKFFLDYKKALSDFVAYHLNEITKAAKRSWQASAWLLERLSPEEFGPKQEVKANVEGITVVNDVPREEVRTIGDGEDDIRERYPC